MDHEARCYDCGQVFDVAELKRVGSWFYRVDLCPACDARRRALVRRVVIYLAVAALLGLAMFVATIVFILQRYGR